MNGFDWRAVLELVLAGGLVGVVANLWLNRRKPEVDRGTLEMARAKNAADIYTTDLAGLRGIIAELRVEVETLNTKVETLNAKVEAADRRAAEYAEARDRHVIERNEARDLSRGLWMLADAAGVDIPFPRPGWL